MIHHMKMHNLIAIVMESEIPEFEILSLDKSSNTNPIYPKHHPTEP